MRSITTFGAAALALAFAIPAVAQEAAAPSASTSAASTPAAPTATTKVTAGQTVKDKTGATIGTVAEVKPDAATGKDVATIKMGADTFAVDTSALAVSNGAAVINASQAEIKGMMKK
jgi:hypothetical protein